MPEVIGIDHSYLSVTDMDVSESFYDQVLMHTLGFRKNTFVLADAPHIQYYNRQFGFVLRPATVAASHANTAPGLHHFCLRVETVADVQEAASLLRAAGIEASEAAYYPDYAPDYVATFFTDPDGIALEITNYRQERRERHDHWEVSCRPT